MTPAQLTAIFPACDAATWAPAITEAWRRFGFTDRVAQAGFLGICGNETGGFTNVRTENTGWSAAQMTALFHIAADKAAELASKPAEARANYCYAHKIGNGDEASGDGWKYRGRGIIQLTGRANYRACGNALGLNLEASPDAILTPTASAAAAAWFMSDYARITSQLAIDSEASFLSAASKVGYTDSTATQRRLNYRKAALTVLTAASQAPAAPPPAPVVQAPPPAPAGTPTAAPSGFWGIFNAIAQWIMSWKRWHQ